MPGIAALVDAARSCGKLSSDAALAERLNVTRQSVNAWRHGRVYPSDEHIASLAGMCGWDAAEWMVKVRALTKTGEAGRVWRRLAAKQ